MVDSSDGLWYQLGYTLERARRDPSGDRVRDLARKLVSFRDRGQSEAASVPASASDRNGRSATTSGESPDWLVTSLSTLLAGGLLRSWPPRERPGTVRVVRAAAAGAASVVLQELAHRAFEGGEPDTPIADRLLSGAARGAIYGAVAEPRLPGPPVLRGVVFGTVEYFLSPYGGLGRVLGKKAPHARLPVLRDLVDDLGSGNDGYVEHLVFGMALSFLAGATDSDEP